MQPRNVGQDSESSREHAVEGRLEEKDNGAKQPFVTPKLTFITPELTKQGSVATLTASLLGSFSP